MKKTMLSLLAMGILAGGAWAEKKWPQIEFEVYDCKKGAKVAAMHGAAQGDGSVYTERFGSLKSLYLDLEVEASQVKLDETWNNIALQSYMGDCNHGARHLIGTFGVVLSCMQDPNGEKPTASKLAEVGILDMPRAIENLKSDGYTSVDSAKLFFHSLEAVKNLMREEPKAKNVFACLLVNYPQYLKGDIQLPGKEFMYNGQAMTPDYNKIGNTFFIKKFK